MHRVSHNKVEIIDESSKNKNIGFLNDLFENEMNFEIANVTKRTQ